VKLSLFGGFRLENGGRILPLRPGSQRLAALLAVRGPLSRAGAARLMWPGADEPSAHARLRTALWRIGGEAPVVIQVENGLAIVSDVTVDVAASVAAARRSIAGHPRGYLDTELLVNGIGELLPGWDDDWVLVERDQLRQLRLRALEAMAERDRAHGRYASAVDAALMAIRLEPLRESAHHVLIRTYLEEQNLVEAAGHYTVLKGLLAAELGVRPAARVTALLAAHGLAR
jgi:DNA-binding SARP family transcriptional activator